MDVGTLVRPPVTLSKMGGCGYSSQTTSDTEQDGWVWVEYLIVPWLVDLMYIHSYILME